jgi:hypothetical protein
VKTQFKFTSSAFPESAGGEDVVKKATYGRGLAEFLAGRLIEAGYVVLGIFPEAEGWVIELDNEQFPLRVNCCRTPEAFDRFLCSIDPQKAFASLWFQRIPTAHVVAPLGDVVEKILAPVASDMLVQ